MEGVSLLWQSVARHGWGPSTVNLSAPPDYDLLIRAARIVCPMTGVDSPGALAVRGDRIVAVGPDLDGGNRQLLDVPDSILLPGLIDLHAHPAKSGSMFGIEPDRHMLARGTTSILSQGDAGATKCGAFIRETIEGSQAHVALAINLSSAGEAGPGGCFEQLEAIDERACIAAIERFRNHIWGISVNTSQNCCGQTDPREVLRRGLRVAEQTGLPLLYGMRRPEDWPLEQQLRQLRRGDVVTYCFRRAPHCIIRDGRVLSEVREARERGIVFDVGHGRSSFDFPTAESALQENFAPDTISTDLQRGHLGELPIHDLPLVMSKLRAAGMPDADVFRAVTARPAQILNMGGEIGSLRIGSRADLVVLQWTEQNQPLVDTHGNVRSGGRWRAIATICSGKLVNAT